MQSTQGEYNLEPTRDGRDRPLYRFEICLIDGDFEHIISPFRSRHGAMQEMERMCRKGVFLPLGKATVPGDTFDAEQWAYIPAHRIIKVTMRRVK
jgi:hypothetical protein